MGKTTEHYADDIKSEGSLSSRTIFKLSAKHMQLSTYFKSTLQSFMNFIFKVLYGIV